MPKSKPLPKIPNSARFLTPAQVAEIFQVREPTVHVWLKRRLMRGVKIGHSWRIPIAEVEAWESGGKP